MVKKDNLIFSHIKKLRKDHKYTQKQLADRLGRSLNYYKGIENGTSIPTVNDIISIANYYNVSVEFLVSDYIKPDLISSTLQIYDSEFRQRVNSLTKKDMNILCSIIELFKELS